MVIPRAGESRWLEVAPERFPAWTSTFGEVMAAWITETLACPEIPSEPGPGVR